MLWNWGISYSFTHRFSISACLPNGKNAPRREFWASREPIVNFSEIHGCEFLWPVTRREAIYTCQCHAGCRRPAWSMSRGTEETSLGANEMDSTDTRGDCKYTMDASSQTEVVCQTGIDSFSWQTLRNSLKGDTKMTHSALVSGRLKKERRETH